MDLDHLRPPGKKVLLEAIREEKTASGLWIPPIAQERFPQLGRVLSCGRACVEGLEPGQFVILANEGCDYDHAYWEVVALTLKDWPEREHCDIETWPVLKEAVESYRRNPSTDDKTITVKTIDGSALNFLASDVLDLQIGTLDDPNLKLDYVDAYMFSLYEGGVNRSFYVVEERIILATVEP